MARSPAPAVSSVTQGPRPSDRAAGRPVRAGWGLVIGALLALGLHAPARWLAEPASRLTQGRLQLEGARGTVWRGEAWLTLTGGADSLSRTTLPSPVQWDLLSPTRLQLNVGCCLTEPVTLRWEPGWPVQRLHVPPHRSQWPAEVLTGLGSPWNTLQLQADLALTTRGLAIEWAPGAPMSSRGQANLDVLDARSRLSTVQPLGSYRIEWLSGDDGGSPAPSPSVRLSTLSGSLLLSGQGQWLSGRLRFQGEAQAAEGRAEALQNLLNLLGRRIDGRTRIQIG